MKVKAEFINTKKEFKWRLVCIDNTGTRYSRWSVDYQGLLVHTFNGKTFALATDYWKGILPIERPFEIIDEIR